MDVKSFGRVRKILEAIDAAGSSDDERLTMTEQLELLIAAGAAPYTHIAASGRSFYTGTTTAIAAVVAVPTTAHMLALYNNQPDGGRCLVIDWISAMNVVSTAVASQAVLLCNIGQEREAIPTDAALTIKKANGVGGAADSSVRTILNATALPATTGLAARWFAYGPPGNKPGAATTPGYGVYADVKGRFIIPPGRYFALHVLANVVGETFLVNVGWHERQLTLA